MIIYVIFLLFLILVASSLYFKRLTNYPPGPFPWPIVGNLHYLRRLSRTFGGNHGAFLELARFYRSDVVAIRLGPEKLIIVNGEKTINEILGGEEYSGRPWNEFIKLRNFGLRKGITMSDGPEWHEIRSWVVRKLRILGFGRREMFDLIIKELIEVQGCLKDGEKIELKPMLSSAVINILWALTTGQKLQNDPKSQYIIELLKRRSMAFDMSGGVLSTFPWIKYIAPESSGYNLLVTINKELKELMMDTINSHIDNYEAGCQNDLIDMFLHEMYTENGSSNIFTVDQLLLILIDLFIAGSLTTVTTLEFLFLNILTNPEAQKRVHEEIDAVVGDKEFPTTNHRLRMPFTEAVITESQRINLVTPVIGPRRLLRDTHLMGYTIPKDTTVLINVWSIHMDPKLYPEPERFNPERFMKDGDYVADDRLIFFGKGRRRCPGEPLARSALFLLFVGVLQRYRLSPVPRGEPPSLTPVPGLIMSPKPYNVILIPRIETTVLRV